MHPLTNSWLGYLGPATPQRWLELVGPTVESETGEGFAPGKSADSVGHRAKAMVADTGDTDPNSQGNAASKIARMDITVLTPPPEETPAE